jgi:alkylation response protein AidB-like acyl-CoA dehydrogenase
MDFSLTEDQQAIQELARQILADSSEHEHLSALENDERGDGYDHALWKSLAEANLLGIAVPESEGGSELGLQALYVLLEEQGRFVTPIPTLPTLVYGALPIAEFGTEAQRKQWLPGVTSGDTLLSAALQESGASDPSRPRTRAVAQGDGFVLDGEKVCVPAAEAAKRVLVPARLDDGRVVVGLIDPRAEGVTLEPGVSNDHSRVFSMRLSGVELGAGDVLGDPDRGAEIMEWLVLRAQVALCATQIGVVESAMRRTAEYISERKQFGRAIATFQGVTMRIADAYIDIEAMRSTLWQAIWQLEAGRPATEAVAVAKWWACRAGQRVVHTAQHLHGGIGSDVDYPIHRFFLWARDLELTLGSAGVQLERIGEGIAAE